MTTLHLQTESGYQTVAALKQNAAQALEEAQALQRAIQNLASSWQGGAQAEFMYEANVVIRQLQNQIMLLQTLAERLQREIQEWEDVDQRGAASMRGVLTGGLGISNVLRQAPFMSATVSIASLLIGLPTWLSSLLDRFLPSTKTVSPLADESITFPHKNQTMNESNQKSILGELLEKAEKEKQEIEGKKSIETPKPKYISQFPAREDDGSFLFGQEKSDSCSLASTKMALQHAVGIDASESDLRTVSSKLDGGYQNNPNKWGTSPSSLDDLVNNQHGNIADADYKAPGSQSINDLEQAAGDGKGIVVSVRNSEWLGSAQSHSVTIVGVEIQNSQKVVLVNDPWPPGEGKRLAIPLSDFERAWYGDAMYISKKN